MTDKKKKERRWPNVNQVNVYLNDEMLKKSKAEAQRRFGDRGFSKYVNMLIREDLERKRDKKIRAKYGLRTSE